VVPAPRLLVVVAQRVPEQIGVVGVNEHRDAAATEPRGEPDVVEVRVREHEGRHGAQRAAKGSRSSRSSAAYERGRPASTIVSSVAVLVDAGSDATLDDGHWAPRSVVVSAQTSTPGRPSSHLT
jgi:hypothetical protein